MAARAHRVRPHLDDKILTAWNGLMISAFAKGGAVLDDARYAGAARRAAEFVIGNLYDAPSGTLLRRYRAGDAAIPGFLDDYTMFVQGLLDLSACSPATWNWPYATESSGTVPRTHGCGRSRLVP